ncbi:MAG: D-alanyl-D-alanine carboxypeptidase family protein [Chloroflexota bacterium]
MTNRRRFPAGVAIALIVATTLLAPARTTLAVPLISARSAIVLDGWSGQTLYSLNAGMERAPASTVKIMTALVILRRHMPFGREVTVSPYAASYLGSTAGLYAGERLTVRDLMYGMLLPSGNDAAVALSETLAPTVSQFATLMNAEARRLGMWHTRYLTPNGFDTLGQVTTARDLAHLARTAMRWGRFRHIVDTRVYQVRARNGAVIHIWTNLNHLLWRGHGIDGVKTGTTIAAGACLVSSLRSRGRWIIEVNLGSLESRRFSDGLSLLDYGFARASSIPTSR